MKIDLEKFQREGYLGPFTLFDKNEAEVLLEDRYIPTDKFTWYKGTHEKSKAVLKTASHPLILEKLRTLLGNDILLWGSHFIGQMPNVNHSWHLDVEYGSWAGVTIWLGLKNLNSKTSVSLISHSHLLDIVPQELKDKYGVDTNDDAAILKEAKKLHPQCDLKTFYLKPGEFIIWSGKIWHSTLNNSNKKRFSIIMQYSTPENVTKIPLNYSYPETKWSDVKPPCVLVSGVDQFAKNKLISVDSIEKSSKFMSKVNSKLYKVQYAFGALNRKISSMAKSTLGR